MLNFGLHFYLAILAIVVSIITFVWQQCSKYNKVKKTSDAGQHHLLPQVLNLMMLLVGILYQSPWISYGSLIGMLISTIEAVLLIRFIIKLIEFSGTQQRRRHNIFLCFIFIGIASLTIVAFLLMMIKNYSLRHFLGGFLNMSATIAASLSCYSDMKLAWTRETAELLSVFWISAALLNAILWTAYGFIPFDKFTFLPNLFGLIMALMQLITYCLFRKSKSPRKRLDSSSSSQAWIFNPLNFLEEERRTVERGSI